MPIPEAGQKDLRANGSEKSLKSKTQANDFGILAILEEIYWIKGLGKGNVARPCSDCKSFATYTKMRWCLDCHCS